MDETGERLRGLVLRGLVLSVDDTGEAQTMTVQTHDGVIRAGVEVMSIHGLGSNPGAAGSTVLLLAVGADQGCYVALPAQDFGVRFGGIPDGGAVLYDDAGNRIVLPGDGTCTLVIAGLLRMVAQSGSIETQAGLTVHGPVTFTDAVTFQAGVTFQADVTVNGALHVSGPVTAPSFNGHG